MKSAVIFTDGILDHSLAKTAHGLILGASRYKIVGIIDKKYAGQDAGTVIINKAKQIPVFADIPQAIQQLGYKPDIGIVGVASIGGVLSESLTQTIESAIENGINIVNGLHTLLADHPRIAPLAAKHHVELIDIRKPKKFHELHMWSGKIADVTIPRIAVMGTDCAIGKRTTAGMLLDLMRQNQIKAEMIYTGQTGWLQGMRYGFILDATLNDFVCGELEYAILQCINEAQPDIILIEGQSALRNPSGPCGSEFICSAGAKYVILQHNPAQEYYICDDKKQYQLPTVASEVELIKSYGAEVIALTINTKNLKDTELETHKKQLSASTKLPVVFPREEGVDSLLPIIKKIINALG